MQKRLTLLLAVTLLGAVGLAPVLMMVARSFFVDGGFSLEAYQALAASGRQQLALLAQSILLSVYVTILSLGAGVPLGVLLGKTDMPFRRTLAAVITAPLLIPPYVIAVAWFSVLGSEGWIGHALAPEAARLVSTAYFGLHGCAAVLFIAYMPVVMLLTMAYLGAVNPRLEAAGRLVSLWPRVLRHITLPLIGPAILFAAILTFLLTLGEVGVPTYLRYPVYAVETMTQFTAFHDFGAATVATIPLLIVTLAVLALEYRLLELRVAELRAFPIGGARSRIGLGRWRLPLFALALVWAFVTVALPFAVLLEQSASFGNYVDALMQARRSILRSIVFATLGASVLTPVGFFCGYLIQNRTLPLWRGVDALTLLLFTLPGTVIGIGLISLWNTPLTNFVYGTAAIVILGYLAQYAVLPARMTSALLQHIPPSLEHAAQLAGANWFMILRKIIVPLASPGLVAIWAVSYVFCLRDLGATMVVYPPGAETLPVRIMTLMANGAPGLIAALCNILVTVTLIPLGAAALWLRHKRPGLQA